MKLELRLERPEDYREVENLTRDAFWDLNSPGCDEHLLAHKLRKIPAFVPELDFVALDADNEGKIVGNILYSKSRVVTPEGREYETLVFGPLSVLPEYQKMGVGGALVERTKEEAKRQGYRGIIIFGHPEYYPRFGFRNARSFGITTEDGKNFDAFMALELYPGALDGITGKYYCDPVFQMDPAEVAEFDKDFPPREKTYVGEPKNQK